tara:strand:+ start:825 stop:1319 length:495 start_codon:yes stop_codon:yes gene_type:complete
MILRKILIILSFIFFSCTSDTNNQSIDLYGNDFSYNSIESISSLTDNVDEFLNKEIVTEGQIVDVCPMKGCWIEVKDFDSQQIIRVKVQDDVIIFPQDSKEKKVIVNGIFTKIEFTQNQAINWKIHLAEEKGIKLNKSDISLEPSDLIEYRIKGLGAKIITELN